MTLPQLQEIGDEVGISLERIVRETCGTTGTVEGQGNVSPRR